MQSLLNACLTLGLPHGDFVEVLPVDDVQCADRTVLVRRFVVEDRLAQLARLKRANGRGMPPPSQQMAREAQGTE
jgi:hypothetical protein